MVRTPPRLLAVCLAGALAAGVLAATGAAAGPREFRTPSGNIGCAFYQQTLRCDIGTGLRPVPPKPRGCPVDWGFGLYLERTGQAKVVCAGDTVLNRGAPVLGYGSTWRRSGFRCTSRPTGVTCFNPAGRGFFLSKERWRRL
jgi:hypothetical protein